MNPVYVLGRRECACGCGERLDDRPNRIYASSACRSRAWRRRTGYQLQARRNPSQTRKSRPRPPRLSYAKAVESIATHLEQQFGLTRARARNEAIAAVQDALPNARRTT